MAIIKVPTIEFKTEDERNAETKRLNTLLGDGRRKINKQSNLNMRYLYLAYKENTVRFFPAKSVVFAKHYNNEYEGNQFKVLSNTSLVFNPDDLTALTSDIVSGYLAIPVRMSLSTVVAKARTRELDYADLVGKSPAQVEEIVNDVSKENVKNNTLGHVLNGGGFLALKADYPIFNINGSKADRIKFDISTYAAISGEFGGGGSSTPTSEANVFRYLGGQAKVLIPVSDIDSTDEGFETFSFFGLLNARVIDGTDKFYENLDQMSTNAFGQYDFTVGLVYRAFKVSGTFLRFTKPGLNDIYPARITIGYIHGFIK